MKHLLSIFLSAPIICFGAPMSFSTYTPCIEEKPECLEHILADGEITESTPYDFVSFMKVYLSRSDIPAQPTVSLNSPGGNVDGALRLGALIKKYKANTYLAPSYSKVIKLNNEVLSGVYTFKDNVACASACSFVFVNGINRKIESKSKFGVHRFSSSSNLNLSEADQVMSYQIRQNFIENNVADEVNTLTISTPSNMMYFLSDAQLSKYHVDNSIPIFKNWSVDIGKVPFIGTFSTSQSDRTTFVSLSTHPNTLFFKIVFNDKASIDLISFFKSNPSFQFDLLVDGLKLNTTGKWTEIEGNTFEGSFNFSNEELTAITNGQVISIKPTFPELSSKLIFKDIHIPTDGLSRKIKILLNYNYD